MNKGKNKVFQFGQVGKNNKELSDNWEKLEFLRCLRVEREDVVGRL